MKRFWTIFCRSLGALAFSVSTSLALECSNDPNECTPKNLCAAATSQKDGNTIWSDASATSKHVSFAKELGINCGVVESEVEELAVEAVENVLGHSLAGHRQVRKSATKYAKIYAEVAGNVASSASKVAGNAVKDTNNLVGKFWKK